MFSTAANHLGAMCWLYLRGNFMLSYIQVMCMHQPSSQLNFHEQMLESLARIIYSRGSSGSAIYTFTLAETIFNAAHNTFTRPEHPLHEDCTVPSDTPVILCLIYKRCSENLFPCKARWGI